MLLAFNASPSTPTKPNPSLILCCSGCCIACGVILILYYCYCCCCILTTQTDTVHPSAFEYQRRLSCTTTTIITRTPSPPTTIMWLVTWVPESRFRMTSWNLILVSSTTWPIFILRPRLPSRPTLSSRCLIIPWWVPMSSSQRGGCCRSRTAVSRRRWVRWEKSFLRVAKMIMWRLVLVASHPRVAAGRGFWAWENLMLPPKSSLIIIIIIDLLLTTPRTSLVSAFPLRCTLLNVTFRYKPT